MQNMRLGIVGVLGVVLSACGGEAGSSNPSGKVGSGGSSPTDAAQGGSSVSSGPVSGTSGGATLFGTASIAAGGAILLPPGTGIATTGPIYGVGGMIGTAVPIYGVGGMMTKAGIPFFPGGGAAMVPTPVNCQPALTAAATDNCQVELSCDNDHIYTSCYNQGSGAWYCTCNSNYSYQAYTVTGSDSSSTCKAVSDLCGSGVQPTFTAAGACTIASEYAGVDNCNLQEQCNQTAELAPGIQAQVQSQRYVTCYDQGGQSRCDCNEGVTTQSYRLSGAVATDSCRTVAALCDKKDVVFTDTPTCLPTYQSVGSGICAMQQECTTSTPISGSVAALLTDMQSAQCQDLKNGNTACTCSDNQGGYRFDMPSATTTLATCISAQGVCSTTTEMKLADVVKCEANFQSATTQSCDAQLACNQTATQGDLQLLVYGDLYVNCQPGTTGSPWSCTCSSGANQATVQIDGTSGWAVCTTAMARCPELVKIAIGSNFSGGPGLVPFPGGAILP